MMPPQVSEEELIRAFSSAGAQPELAPQNLLLIPVLLP
jgi:hypothetical protein